MSSCTSCSCDSSAQQTQKCDNTTTPSQQTQDGPASTALVLSHMAIPENAAPAGPPRTAQPSAARRALAARQVPDEILNDPELNSWVKRLPKNYKLEIHKTVWRIRQANAKCVALQFPEGLLMFSTMIADIVEKFTGAETMILGDVTYGACCVDDLGAKALGADFLVHYGHSCLINVKDCVLSNLMYVFVEISIDVDHVVEMAKKAFSKDTRLVMAGTVQFIASMRVAAERLNREHFSTPITVPQARPLSGGELLGCTSPNLMKDNSVPYDAILYLGDGRFHLESIMIHNPSIQAYRYDPYTQVMSREGYDHAAMHALRKTAIERAQPAKRWGIILGTLGRQGSPRILGRLQKLFTEAGKNFVVVLLSEIFPSKLALFEDVDAWVQIACPRLSIDWGHHFSKPLLSPYEAEVCLGATPWREQYPMDHYAKDGGKWAVYTDKE